MENKQEKVMFNIVPISGKHLPAMLPFFNEYLKKNAEKVKEQQDEVDEFVSAFEDANKSVVVLVENVSCVGFAMIEVDGDVLFIHQIFTKDAKKALISFGKWGKERGYSRIRWISTRTLNPKAWEKLLETEVTHVANILEVST